MAQAGYSIGEIVWLLSMEHREAAAYDEGAQSSWPSGEAASAISAGEPQLPVVVRWREVHEARRRIVTEKRDQEALEHKLRGELSEEEIARKVGFDRSTVNRRFHAKIEEIQRALGGPPVIREALSVVPLCITCGKRPRARAYALRRVHRTYWQTVEPDRELSFCAVCLPVESRERLLLRKKDLVHVHKARSSAA